ncbi:asparaginyl-tRNA synthetase-like isoform X3 [Apostichopus japonicus]
MQATAIEVIGTCDNSTYPLKHKTRHTMEYTRQYLHLRSRTNAFGALLRIRHAVTVGFHKFFTEEGFLNVQTPVLTSNDCEGAGDLFKVTPDDESLSETTEGFFDKDAYLTVSGQLHLEIVCCSHGRVYTFNPAFRAENSRSRRHLAEFSMVEAELPFTRDITDLTKCMESMLRTVTDEVYTQSNDDVQLFNDRIAKGHRDTVENCINQPFLIISYAEAINILQNSKESWEFEPKWGADLQSEHEKYIVMHCGNRPVFVIDYPQSLKAFYALSNDDKNETVAAVDLLVPGVGELIGGSLREHRLHLLKHKLASLGLEKEYQWYLDLRSFGSIPHGGFGLGFERYLLFLLGVDNIRDVIPFPRFSHSCVL